jgi:hypothetical protein
MHRYLGVLLILFVVVLILPTSAFSQFEEGDIYIASADGPAIMRVDLPSYDKTIIYTGGNQHVATYDPYRDLLLFRYYTGGIYYIRGIDHTGTPAFLSDDNVYYAAPRGDGTVYLYYHGGFYKYLDSDNNVHDLLDTDGMPFNSYSGRMLYHGPTNSIIVMGGWHCTDPDPARCPDQVCAMRIPLTRDGTRVAGSTTELVWDMAYDPPYWWDEREWVLGLSHGPNESIFFSVNTNGGAVSPRMQLLDPVTMTLDTFASIELGKTWGVYSHMLGLGVALQEYPHASENHQLRSWTYGETGVGTALTSGCPHGRADCMLVEINSLSAPQNNITGHTPAGTAIETNIAGEFYLTFDEVVSEGRTTVDFGVSPPPLPAGFVYATDPPLHYDATTDAGYTGTVGISVAYDPADVVVEDESGIKIIHYDATLSPPQWVYIPTTVDPVAHRATGQTNSLSMFALAFPNPVDVMFAGLDAVAHGGVINVTWQVSSDEPIAGFRVYRRVEGTDWSAAARILLEAESRCFTDDGVAGGVTYDYRVGAVTPSGHEFLSPPVSATATPYELTLSQNYPNPFNPTTTIAFTLPKAMDVDLSVMDVRGSVVAALFSGTMPEGRQEVTWNGRDSNGNEVGSGVYFYRLRSGKKLLIGKMVLIK